MYLLDTNIVSDLRRPSRITPSAERWFQVVPNTQIFISSISIFEIQHGIVALRRRDPPRATHLQRWFETAVLATFIGRIIPLDTEAALKGAELHVGRSRIVADRLIAAIALARGMTVVTRNVKDFAPLGVKTFDPFKP
jgi:toxin FitB